MILPQAREGDDKVARFVAMMGGMIGAGEEDVQDPEPVDAENETMYGEGSGELREEQVVYRPHIPGRILYIYR